MAQFRAAMDNSLIFEFPMTMIHPAVDNTYDRDNRDNQSLPFCYYFR